MNPQELREGMINDLNVAAENGDNDAIKRLANQITPPMATEEWQVVIRKAACSDHMDTLNVLMDECHADLGDQQHILGLIVSVVDNTSLDMMHFLMKQAMKAGGQETDQDEAAFIRSLDAKDTDELLCYATWNDSRQILSYLADILNITSLKDNQKLIEKAMVSCQPDIIKYLIEEQQVDVNATDEDGNSIVFHTVINNDLELLTYLIEQQHADITLKNNRGEGLLHFAVCYSGADDKRILRYLIESCHLDVNKPTDNGVTPLDLACNANSNLNLVRYLVETCGAKVRTGEHEGLTQLHICACQHSPIEILEYFINEVGQDPQAVTHEGDTLLHCVCAGNATSHYLNLVKLLVETYHLDPNARKPSGLIPLHLAAAKSDQESILYLINQDPTTLSVCNDKGMTPFLALCGYQNLEFIRTIIHDYHVVLKPLSNLSENPVLCAAGNPDVRVIQALVKEYGLSPNVTDASGTNAICYAVATQNTDIIPILVNTLNLDPNAPNHAGITPLMLAIHKGNPDMVQTLIQVGADINLRNVNGDTPLIQAIDTENVDVVQKLIQAGADVSLCDADGKTAFMHLAPNIPVTTLKILLLLAAAQTEAKVPCPPCPPSQSISDFLQANEQDAMPDWLRDYQPGDKPDIRLFQRAVYYPGAGHDFQPLELFSQSHSAHVFIYLDYMEHTYQREDFDHQEGTSIFPGYTVIGTTTYDLKQDLAHGSFQPHMTPKEIKKATTNTFERHDPFARLVVCEKNKDANNERASERIAVLIIAADAIVSYDMLVANRNMPVPLTVILQDHGLGGNYDKFGKGGILEAIAQRSDIRPQYLLVGQTTQVWDGYEPVPETESIIGASQNHPRTLYRLIAK